MTRRPALTLCLYLVDRPVLLVGTGPGSDERAGRLASAKAQLTRCSEEEWRSGKAAIPDHLFALIAHSQDDELNAEAARWARARGILSYAHDQPEVSDFAFPALSQRGPLQIAISTQASAPALAAQLRRQVDQLLESGGKGLDTVIAELEAIREKFPRGGERMAKLKALAAKVRLVGSLEIDN